MKNGKTPIARPGQPITLPYQLGEAGGATMLTLLLVSRTVPLEGVHPLEGGIIRLKFRRDRGQA